ncbi:unnamed protein product [Nippostrongylus brasiliensis]|uniref:Secreted protein n=1 Tax=Nippostrongylus brasiliensis TaxID=27835 RepID=A0A0N4XF99_NIPBR|nr:unnamed protein product [Nippostrongylus brasiliensis]
MVSTRLIFLLMISEAIADGCRSGNVKFCAIIRDAHISNEDGLKRMERTSEGDGKNALKSADSLIVAVLNANESELITSLEAALAAELSAYVQVEADCFRLGRSYNGTCEKILFEVTYATLGLIMAIAEVHPDTQTKTKVENVISDLAPYMFQEPTSVYRDKIQEIDISNHTCGSGTEQLVHADAAYLETQMFQALQMVSSRLIFLVAVLVISEALAEECNLGDKDLCELLEDALKANEDGLKLMTGDLVGNGKEALTSANKLVTAALKAGGQLITALKKALEAELSAYVKVKADCKRLGESYSGKCEAVLFEVGYVTAGLMHTITVAHPNPQTRTKVDNILTLLVPYMFVDPASVYRDALHASGQQVLAFI